jgi:hypothetical protein
LNLRYVEKERKKTKINNNNDPMLIKQITIRKKKTPRLKNNKSINNVENIFKTFVMENVVNIKGSQ